MENYFDLPHSITEGLGGNWEESTSLVLAALMLCVFLMPFRRVSYLAVLIAGGAIALLYRGGETGHVTAILIAANIALIAFELHFLRSKALGLERSFSALAEAVRRLEIAEERRQSFIARKSVRLLPSVDEMRAAADRAGDEAPAQPLVPDAPPAPKFNGTAPHRL